MKNLRNFINQKQMDQDPTKDTTNQQPNPNGGVVMSDPNEIDHHVVSQGQLEEPE